MREVRHIFSPKFTLEHSAREQQDIATKNLHFSAKTVQRALFGVRIWRHFPTTVVIQHLIEGSLPLNQC